MSAPTKPKRVRKAKRAKIVAAPDADGTPPEATGVSRTPEGRFPAGVSGNPLGRPKGSRNKFGEAFIEDFFADWIEHGKGAIQKMREERPHEYVKAAVAILPKQVDVRVSELDELNDEQLDARIRQLASILEIGFSGGAAGEEAPARPKPSRLI